MTCKYWLQEFQNCKKESQIDCMRFKFPDFDVCLLCSFNGTPINKQMDFELITRLILNHSIIRESW